MATTKKKTPSKSKVATKTKVKKVATKTKVIITPAARARDKKIAAYLEKSGQISFPIQVSECRHTLHTGLFGVDLIMCGGWRRGREYTVLGMPSEGKSSFAQEAIAAAQRQKVMIWHYDIEAGSSKKYMQTQGIIPPDAIELVNGVEIPKYRLADGSKGYYYFQPDTGDEAYQSIVNLCNMMPPIPHDDEGKLVDGKPTVLVVIDSYEAMNPEGVTIETNPLGAAARMHSRYQKQLRSAIRRCGAALVATNQIRMKVMAFGNPETDGGGLALQFYADAKMRIRRRREQKEGSRYVSEVKFKCTKSKMHDPFNEYEARLVIGRGFDRAHDRLEFLTMAGEVEVDRGKYIFTNGPKTADGKPKKLPYKTARKLMLEPEWRKRCFQLRRSQKLYDWYFGVDK